MKIAGGLNVFSNGLNKYDHEWIEHNYVSFFGLNKYFGEWIE